MIDDLFETTLPDFDDYKNDFHFDEEHDDETPPMEFYNGSSG